ncbi:phosphoadenylyl-sulfate reductase [Microlunatus sp. Gsoil 973]|uniref:phosphoadenylyl-sulfate reductase n=1 Tax=Microlunatus sp. Gsoil 973 TaxID=2672569 RepID=UPI0012B45CE2|nr:phosphoadenylyl-sulfate reductase [Microlunatus sp. Gsoil 973]QGN33271.1 phosphoadenylyl-sulfate reductase [Microlunatus sp. Gsoil 973]
MAVEPELRGKYAALAADARVDLEAAQPEEILAWALGTFEDRMCLTSSMESAVLIDMAARIRPGTDVVFLDTGYHFAETVATLDRVRERYPVNVRVIEPRQSVAEQDVLFGARLHDRDPDACCTLRKVEPLRRALQPYVAWASGIRRDETLSRRTIGVVDWDDNRGMVKINPLAAWTQEQVDRYVAEHDVITHPLLAQGYPSIGCAPCTRKVRPGESPRAGRWAGSGKDECGLHLDEPSTGPGVGSTSLNLTGGSFISLPKDQ